MADLLNPTLPCRYAFAIRIFSSAVIYALPDIETPIKDSFLFTVFYGGSILFDSKRGFMPFFSRPMTFLRNAYLY
jgi:hypothetical protein